MDVGAASIITTPDTIPPAHPARTWRATTYAPSPARASLATARTPQAYPSGSTSRIQVSGRKSADWRFPTSVMPPYS